MMKAKRAKMATKRGKRGPKMKIPDFNYRFSDLSPAMLALPGGVRGG